MVYAPAIGYPFVYEDLRDIGSTLDVSQVPEQVFMQPLRAVTSLSRAADLVLFGIQPWGAHLSNILWHALNSLIVLAIAWRVFPPVAAVAAAGVFAWHPLQVEAVAYVASRAELVSTCGVLLALWAAACGRLAHAWLGVAVACLSKESALMAWLLVPLWAVWAAPAFRVWLWLAVGAIGGAAGLVVVFWRLHHWTIVLDPALAGEQLVAVFRLLSLLVVPVGFTVDHDWQTWAFLGRVALIAGVAVTCWAVTVGWGRKWLAFAWLWTVVALAPRFVVPLYEGLHEHHLYLALVGWSLAAGALVTAAIPKGHYGANV